MRLEKSRWGRIVVYSTLAVWGVFTLFPIYWTVITAFKTPNDVYAATPKFLPFVDFAPTFDAWVDIFQSGQGSVEGGRLPFIAKNSLVAALGSAIGATLLGSLAAYGLARFRFRRWKNEDIGFFFISQRMFPPIALVVPYFILFNWLNMLDKLSKKLGVKY